MKTSLSVLVPVSNEQHLVYNSLQGVKVLDTSPNLERVEMIVVDDCSTDDTPQVLKRLQREQTGDAGSKIQWVFLRHEKNRGKGAAVKTALQRATCEISVIHDADLEYHPRDLIRIVDVFLDEEADAVYGSRFAGGRVRRVLLYRHQLGNEFVTFLCNIVSNLSLKLMPRVKYVASDVNPLYLQTLEALSNDRPYMQTSYCDVTNVASFPQLDEGYDTVICLNVIEHLEDDRRALLNIRSVLAPRGRAIILVPQGQWNFGTLDTVLGHQRRYSKVALAALARHSGFEATHILEFNRFGTAAWFFNGKILGRRSFGLLQIKLLNLLTPLLRRMDPLLPLPGLSLIAVMERRDTAPQGSRVAAAANAQLKTADAKKE